MKKPVDYKQNSQKRIAKLFEEFSNGKPFITQQAFADTCGVSKFSMSQYLNGSNAPGNITAAKIANRFNVNPLWVMGFDVERASDSDRFWSFAQSFNAAHPDLLNPVSTKKYPVIGEVACGEPIIANEEYDVLSDGNDVKADAVVIARGDSMVGARIHDGDTIFVRFQDSVENGDIAVVIIENETTEDAEVTLKRFFKYGTDLILLKPENPSYEDMVFRGSEMNRLRIIGKAVAFQSNL